jgi:hypothetical protein
MLKYYLIHKKNSHGKQKNQPVHPILHTEIRPAATVTQTAILTIAVLQKEINQTQAAAAHRETATVNPVHQATATAAAGRIIQ